MEAKKKRNPRATLRITAGLHRDAEQHVAFYQALTIGSGKACDLILCDEGVESLHCMIQLSDYGVCVKALGKAVFIDQTRVPEGGEKRMSLNERLRLGEAEIEFEFGTGKQAFTNIQEFAAPDLTPEQPETLVASVAHTVNEATLTTNWWKRFTLTSHVKRSSFALVSIGLLSIAGLVQSGLTHKASPASSLPAATGISSERRSYTPDGKPAQSPASYETVSKTTDADVEIDTNEKTDSARVYTAEQQSPEQVGANLEEVLRLSGIVAEVKKRRENGVFAITRFSGDKALLERKLKSRAVQELEGIKQVVIENLPVIQPNTLADFGIISVNNSSDPYLITDDGTYHYLGAELYSLKKGDGATRNAGGHWEFSSIDEKVIKFVRNGTTIQIALVN